MSKNTETASWGGFIWFLILAVAIGIIISKSQR
jgi:hypothetical protein